MVWLYLIHKMACLPILEGDSNERGKGDLLRFDWLIIPSLFLAQLSSSWMSNPLGSTTNTILTIQKYVFSILVHLLAFCLHFLNDWRKQNYPLNP